MRAKRHLPPEVLTDEEVRALMNACSARAPTGLRHRALITVLYRAGLRITEALELRPKDLDLAKGAIRVLRGKGGKSRTVAWPRRVLGSPSWGPPQRRAPSA